MEAVKEEKKQNLQMNILMKDHSWFLLAVFCFWFAIYIYAPVFGVYLKAIGFSYSSIGFILGGYGIMQILLRLPLGILSDRLHGLRKHLLVTGFIMALISSLLLVFFQSFLMVTIARLLAGVTASMWVMATVLYSQYFVAGNASKAMSILQFVTTATQFLSMAISGYLVDLFGWKFPFWVGAVAAFLGAFFAWKVKEINHQKTKTQFHRVNHLMETLRIPQLKTITFLSLIAHAILFSTIFGFTPIYAAQLGIDEKSLLWLTSAFFIPHAFASLYLVFYKLNGVYFKPVIISSFAITSIFLLIVPFSKTIVSVSLVHAGLGLSLGFIFPLLISKVVEISPPEMKMSAMGFYQSFYALGIFIGPISAGKIAEWIGLNEVFYFMGILTFITTFFALLANPAKNE